VLLVCAALAAGTLAGCGRDPGRDAEQVVDDYLEAIADGDGERACNQLTENLQRRLIDAAPAGLEATDCRTAAAAIAGTLSQEQRQRLRDTAYGHVSVDGDRATVRLGDRGTAELTKTNGGAYQPLAWRISGGVELAMYP
jgi:hypothetical protein